MRSRFSSSTYRRRILHWRRALICSCHLKSKEELIGDIITLLDSPIKNVIASLKSSNTKISNLLKSIEEKASSNKNASIK